MDAELNPAQRLHALGQSLWLDSINRVDATTYLPLRSVVKSIGARPGGQLDLTTVNDVSYLAPTAANLAKVQISIPAGFTRESLP